MKRTKQVARSRRDDDSNLPSFLRKPPEKAWKWPEDVAGQPDDAFRAYDLHTRYDKGVFLLHPKFGKGVVTRVEGPRIEVLFQDGQKKLGHGGT